MAIACQKTIVVNLSERGGEIKRTFLALLATIEAILEHSRRTILQYLTIAFTVHLRLSEYCKY